MLVLSRREQEVITIGPDVRIVVTRIDRDKVRLGVTAPRHIRVDRLEVAERIQQQPPPARS